MRNLWIYFLFCNLAFLANALTPARCVTLLAEWNDIRPKTGMKWSDIPLFNDSPDFYQKVRMLTPYLKGVPEKHRGSFQKIADSVNESDLVRKMAKIALGQAENDFPKKQISELQIDDFIIYKGALYQVTKILPPGAGWGYRMDIKEMGNITGHFPEPRLNSSDNPEIIFIGQNIKK